MQGQAEALLGSVSGSEMWRPLGPGRHSLFNSKDTDPVE